MSQEKINRYINEVLENRNERCGFENKDNYCSKKNMNIDGSDCIGCWCYQDSVTMKKRDWNWTDGYLNEEIGD
jgi:hypothetical protein